MDRPRVRSAPVDLAVAGLFGGADVLVGLALVGLAGGGSTPTARGVIAVLAFGVVVVSGVVLMRRLRRSPETLEHTIRQVEEAGSRLKVLVEHVPAAVYIDVADPDDSDGGRLADMSPQVTGILGYRPEGARRRSRALAEPDPPDDRAAAIAAYEEHWRTASPAARSTGC